MNRKQRTVLTLSCWLAGAYGLFLIPRMVPGAGVLHIPLWSPWAHSAVFLETLIPEVAVGVAIAAGAFVALGGQKGDDRSTPGR